MITGGPAHHAQTTAKASRRRCSATGRSPVSHGPWAISLGPSRHSHHLKRLTPLTCLPSVAHFPWSYHASLPYASLHLLGCVPRIAYYRPLIEVWQRGNRRSPTPDRNDAVSQALTLVPLPLMSPLGTLVRQYQSWHLPRRCDQRVSRPGKTYKRLTWLEACHTLRRHVSLSRDSFLASCLQRHVERWQLVDEDEGPTEALDPSTKWLVIDRAPDL